MSVGIYRIYNLINGKSYVGLSSVSIEGRVKAHLSGNGSVPLKYAVLKYGSENFEYEILEECDVNLLRYRERFYIEKYNSMSPNGYNLTSGGELIEGYHQSEETKSKIRQGRLGKKHSKESILKLKQIASTKFTEEVRHKMSIAKQNPTEEARRNISKGQVKRFETQENPFKGKHHTIEVRSQLSIFAKNRVGNLNNFYGRTHSDATKLHLSEAKSESNNGRCWFTNGSENKFMYPEEGNRFILENPSWRKGRTQYWNN